MELTDDQWAVFEDLSGSGLNIRKMAMYFQLDPDKLLQEYFDTTSLARYHFDRGILVAEVKRDLEQVKAADLGNLSAIHQLDKRRKERELEDLKERLLNGH